MVPGGRQKCIEIFIFREENKLTKKGKKNNFL